MQAEAVKSDVLPRFAPAPLPTATPINAQALARANESMSVVQLIERVATMPDVDIDRLERLLEMHERIQSRNAEQAFSEALAAMGPHLPIIEEHGQIKNNSGAVQSTFARWEDINEQIKPVLAEYGFALTFKTTRATDANLPAVTGILRHREGHKEETTVILPIDGSGNKNSVQQIGSSMSYGQRYAAKLLLNLTSRKSEDDDGKRAGLSAGADAAISAINMCSDLIELRDWRARNTQGLDALPKADRDAVVRHFNTRLNKLKAQG